MKNLRLPEGRKALEKKKMEYIYDKYRHKTRNKLRSKINPLSLEGKHLYC